MIAQDSPLKRMVRDCATGMAVRGLLWLRHRRPFGKPATQGCVVIGFLETASGLGAAARGLLRALEPLSPSRFSITHHAPTPVIPNSATGPSADGETPLSGAELALHVYNPDVLLGLVKRYGGRLWLPNRTNVAVVNWETQQLPSSWQMVLALYEQLAAPSRFTAAAIARATGRKVHVLPNCVALRAVRSRARTDGRFEFISFFDHHSDFARKNPLAAVRAFRLASRDLPSGISGRLRIKCHANTPPAIVGRLKAEAGGAAVEVMAETLAEPAMQRLWEESDCLVSLHRSEGFGLPVAEALARGIPVVATRQGGVLDFVDEQGGLLVDGAAARRDPDVDEGGYQEWSGWIDPDIDASAAALRKVMLDYDGEVARARVGRQRVASWTSPDAIRRELLTMQDGWLASRVE